MKSLISELVFAILISTSCSTYAEEQGASWGEKLSDGEPGARAGVLIYNAVNPNNPLPVPSGGGEEVIKKTLQNIGSGIDLNNAFLKASEEASGIDKFEQSQENKELPKNNNVETRGVEIMFKPDPGSQPRLVLIDGQYVPETPIPVNGSILDPANSQSSMAMGANSDAQESDAKRQSMKNEFNSNKQQYQQAIANRQAEQDANALEGQSSGQQQDFFATLNNAIMAGTPLTAGRSGASQSSYVPNAAQSQTPKMYCDTHYCATSIPNGPAIDPNAVRNYANELKSK
jgi:hypothetical protein